MVPISVELATAYVSLSTSARGLRKEIDRELGSAADAAGKKAGGGFGASLKKWGKRGAIVAGGAVAAGLGVALTKGLGRLTAIENAQAKLRGLGHDAGSVDAIMKNALASVKGTAFGLGEAATTAAGAVAAGIKPGKELEGVLSSVANSAAAAGVGMDEMGGIYNKVASLGKAQNDVLQQVADKGIPIYQALADQLGVTTDEVFKMASAGKIGFEDFEAAMTSASGTVAKEMGQTLTGSLANAWAAVGRLGASLLTGVFDKLAPAVQGVTGWIDKLEPVAERVGNAIGVAVSWAADQVGKLAQQFRDGEGAGGRIRDVLERVRDVAVGVATWLGENVVEGVKNLIQQFRDGEGTGGKFRDFLEAVRDLAMDVYGWVADNVVPAIQGFFTEMRNGEGAGGAFRDVLEDTRDALEGLVGKATEFGTWLVENRVVLAGVAGALLGYKATLTAIAIAKGVAAAATAVWTGAQKLLNAALKANPIGLVVAAIMGLIAVLVTAYHTNDDFRAWVDDAWRKVKNVISGVVTWFRDTAWPWMRDTMASIGSAASSLYQDKIKPAWDKIRSAISTVVTWIRDTAWPWVRDAYDKMAAKAGDLRDKAVGAWNKLRDGVSDGWTAIKRVFDRFKTGLTDLQTKFGRVKDGIASVWSNLTTAVAGPIRSVIQFVNDKFLGPLERNLNRIPGVDISLPRIPVPSMPGRQNTAAQDTYGRSYGGGLGGYAGGGLIPGPWRGPTADNVLGISDAGVPVARVNPREFITRVKATDSMRRHFPGWLEHINVHGRPPGFSRGGRVGGDVSEALADAGSWLLDLFRSPRKALSSLMDKLLSGIGGSIPAQVAIGAAKSTVGGLVGWVKENLFGGEDVGGAPSGSGMGWQRQWAIIKAMFPGAGLSSAYRPGAVTASGFRSFHGLGRAVDLVGSSALMMQMYQWIVRNFGRSPEIYFGPGGWAKRYGKTHFLTGVTAATHPFNHVHWAHSDGGHVRTPKPLLFDQGGYLPVGTSLVRNNTGRPEPLGRLDKGIVATLDDRSMALLERVADRPVSVQVDSREVAYAGRRGEASFGPPGRWGGQPRLGRPA